MGENLSQGQPHKSVFKEGFSSEMLEMYKLYVERIMKHYDLRLKHFTIYFGFQSGLSAGVGYFIRPHISNFPTCIPQPLYLAFAALGVVGALFAVAWLLVTRNDRTIQLLLNDVLGGFEKEIFERQDLAVYLKTNEYYSPEAKWGVDVIDINSYVAAVFLIAWLLFIGILVLNLL
jgi:hypothetical protein